MRTTTLNKDEQARIVCRFENQHERVDKLYFDPLESAEWIASETISMSIRNGCSKIIVTDKVPYKAIRTLEMFLSEREDNPSNFVGFFGGSLTYYHRYFNNANNLRKIDEFQDFINYLGGEVLFGQVITRELLDKDITHYLKDSIIPKKYLPELILLTNNREEVLVAR